MNRRRLAAEWENFRMAVIPFNASVTQVFEMRRAFYAGAWAIYQLQIEQTSPADEVTEEDLDFMRDLEAEMREFHDAVKAGRA
jgi:hypothetical protein